MSFKTLGSLAHTTAKAGSSDDAQLAMEGRETVFARIHHPGLIETIRRETAEGPRMGERDARKTLLGVRPLRKWRASLCSGSDDSSYRHRSR